MKTQKFMRNDNGSRKKFLWTAVAVAAVGVTAGGIGAGYQAQFTDTLSAETKVTATELSVGDFSGGGGNDSPGTDPNNPNGVNSLASYTETVANLYPGESAYRYFTVKNTGTANIGQLILIQNVVGNLADVPAPVETYPKQLPSQAQITTSGGGNPLQVTLQGCSVPWVLVNNAPKCNGVNYTYYSQLKANQLNGNNPLMFSLVSTSGTTLTKVTSGPSYVQPYGAQLADGLNPDESIYFLSTYTLPTTSTNEYQGKSAVFTYGINAKRMPQ